MPESITRFLASIAYSSERKQRILSAFTEGATIGFVSFNQSKARL